MAVRQFSKEQMFSVAEKQEQCTCACESEREVEQVALFNRFCRYEGSFSVTCL